jgi:small-conductance mechanosensitive channel
MDKYLKMADVFDLPILGSRAEFFPLCLDESSAMIAAHAINSHDDLVESMQHYKQEAEQWEVRATNEASRAKDLEADVDSAKKQIELLKSQIERVHDSCSTLSHQEVLMRNILRFAFNGKIYTHELHAAHLDGRVTTSRGVDVGGCRIEGHN